jgi:hypothetical protein
MNKYNIIQVVKYWNMLSSEAGTSAQYTLPESENEALWPK